ncbi:uncharacterized protein DDB_G0283357 isoform X3 [Toxorhynchites rutilus septentrionalis]|uniref:uncharacterized protein DDB_G0283357 isoform X3 n=1 Tax=Toxorhynchites rutilus septentrionalis TaxID=329112 RepID=UPI0024787778|nr:uncharacterized protein DDB_G0283357 isoform X3 [Toxorhynchites rutilus septentrionalis]
MDIGMERNEGGAATIGTLFQHIVNEMKNTGPLWEDLIAKATKLHACLRAAIQALAAYLEAFQKIADAATNSKGATKEIGTALTRVCLRHKAVETRMKTFTAAMMDYLIVPLQDKLEDWKKQVVIIDKDHAKEYKRCRAELKKRSSDTLRLQKKARKGQADNLHILVESSMQDVTLRRCELEEVERKSLRTIMVEERSRYCTFVNMLQPVVHEECEVMSELSHLQEAMQLIAVVTKDPSILPQASEELILESKTNINLYPDSPGGSNSQGGCSNSLGSRKSSVCSISSMNSSSSGSPGHQFQRSLSQYSPAIRLKPGESSDSGFCSSPALTSQASTLASQSHAVSTWPPHTQDGAVNVDRPHTISSAYEKGHQRPALTVYTFQNPEVISENQKSPANVSCRPPLPVRCSSLERPLSTSSMKNANANIPRQCPSPIPAHITKEHPQLQPTYVNMTELASMAASKITNNNNSTNQLQSSAQTSIQPQHITYQQLHSPVLSSASSLISPDSSATNAISSPDVSACSTQTPQNTPQTGSPQTPIYSCSTLVVETGTSEAGDSCGATNGNGSDVFSTCVGAAVNTKSEHVTAAENESNKPKSSTSTNVTDDNISNQSNTNNTSQSITDKDILKCTGSVLEKTSMFEQQINNNQHPQQGPLNTPTRNENIYGRKNDDISKTSSLIVDKDADRIDNETIEELNNLIGELDLFQKEHELRLEEHYQSTNSPNENGLEHTSNGLHFSSNNSDSSISDRHDRTSISSSMNIEGFNTSLNSTNLGHEYSLGYSDNNINMYSGIDQQTSDSDTGFENPSFIHLNDAEIVVKRQNNFENVDPENYYSQNMSEIVVLRSKDTKSDATRIDENPSTDGQQRLSSFKLNSRSASPALSSFTISKSPTHSITSLIPTSSSVSSQLNVASSKTNDNNNHIMKLQQQQQPSPLYASTNGNGKFSLISMPSDEHINNRIKPAITPRPASLSGAARVTRRSSINTVKPPPPVRRSSSVTPNPNTGANSPNLTQQSLGYTSSESLPPPPAYLLDSTAGNSPIPGNVAGTVKALNEIRHKPASPSVLRRASQNFPAQQQSPLHHTSNAYSSTPKHETSSKPASPYTPQSPPNSFHSSGDSPNMPSNRSSKPSHHQHGIYAQPKQLSTMSSFRTSSPAPQKQSTGFLAQLNARIAPNKAQQQLTSQNYEGVYHRNNPADQRSFYSSSSSSNQQSQSQQGIYSSTQQSSTQQQQQQQQQQQAQSHYNHHQQQQAVAPTNQRDGKTQIYPTSHSQSQLQQQHHHYQQQQQQLKYQQQQQSTSQHYYQPQQQYATQNIYVSTNPFVTSVSPVHSVSSYSPSSFGKSPRESNSASGSVGGGPSSSSHDNSSHDGVHCRSSHQSRNSGSVGSANMSTHKVLTKTSTGFLENLNARLAEQRLSGKAFAVRNLINSKALPDPRICHESLMDQIKRGATLKRNRTVNDRSAPKIH